MKHKLTRKHTGEKFECLNEVWDFIETKQSNIPEAGVGIFAKQDIPNNVLLTWYKGFKTNKAINAAYTWNYKSDITGQPIKIEADLCATSNPMAFVNTFANDEQYKLLNCKTVTINERIYYKTVKKIKKGQELIVDYKNSNYFKNKK
jgi:hypothetical protein